MFISLDVAMVHCIQETLKGKLPVKLIYSETFETRVEALKREKEIKGWRKDKKEQLINSLHRTE